MKTYRNTNNQLQKSQSRGLNCPYEAWIIGAPYRGELATERSLDDDDLPLIYDTVEDEENYRHDLEAETLQTAA